MGRKCRQKKKQQTKKLRSLTPNRPTRPIANSLLDVMKDGVEFASLCNYHYENLNIQDELKRSIGEIETARGKRAICYFANLFAQNNSIDTSDDVPFTEMVNSIPADVREIDVLIVTPGGSGEQAASFVRTLRNRFDVVNFLVIDKAMSAGTILIMSGDEIVMSKESKFGPIDPQVPSKEGRYVPAQSILLAIQDIKDRGLEKINNHEQPDWTDLQILHNISPYELGSAISSSNYSIELVKQYLHDYKFKNWTIRRSSGDPVTPEYRAQRAEEIAKDLCDHTKWKSHGYGISREEAQNVCRLEICHADSIDGLDRAMRRLRALLFWMGANLNYVKLFASQEYCLIKGRS